jgi:hypothetical protein
MGIGQPGMERDRRSLQTESGQEKSEYEMDDEG